MMLTLMALVLALALTGWLQTVNAFEDAAEWAEELHEALANALLALAAVHALAAVIIGRWQRVTLVRRLTMERDQLHAQCTAARQRLDALIARLGSAEDAP